MLFQAVMKFLFRLVEIKILVNWGLVPNCVLRFVWRFRKSLETRLCDKIDPVQKLHHRVGKLIGKNMLTQHDLTIAYIEKSYQSTYQNAHSWSNNW
jgi:hypothetical protein